ncbi:MAG: hypothetical protein JST00_24675 [Deltaproteobacteria bacterium]|nr:hypothetical protein [Deltaproteobacteria bacterium]
MALFEVRPDERRPATLAFLALLGITASHTLIETARDALFLTKVPITTLPALYIAIAIAGLATTRVGAALETRRQRRDAASANTKGARGLDPVATSLVGAAILTAAFWLGTASPNRGVLYALYVYSGLFASWVAGRLWIRLGDVFDVTQAKRLYGVVGTGAVLGAVLGAAAARASLAFVEVRSLLLVGAVLLVATAVGPAAMLPRPAAEPRRHGERRGNERAGASLADQAKDVVRHPYLVRVLGIALAMSAAGTCIDFVFKSEVARAIQDPRQLASFLATVALATNVASLVAQSVGVGIVMRVLGVHRALYVMPLLLLPGALTGALGLGLFAALAMRGVDGTLRHSLQKTSMELLFVPLPDGLRTRAKPIIDLVGQRGGQAMTSLAILGVGALFVDRGLAARAIGGGALVACIVWLLLARGIRSRYLDVFRETISRGRIELSAEMPALDVSALEALIASLSSRNDAQVLGALDLLAAQSRGSLIPSLILFHPSKPIVLRSLELLVESGRTDFVPVADRLLDHPDPEIRTAALRARAAVEHDAKFLEARLGDGEDEIRATALAALVAAGDLGGDDADRALEELAASAPPVRRALARALGEVRVGANVPSAIERITLRLASDDDVATRVLAATAMGHLACPSFLPVLVGMLHDRRAGLPATEALAEMGEVAIAYVDEAIDRDDLSEESRWRLVRALSRSSAPSAVRRLADRLVTKSDTAIRARILRALRKVQSSGAVVPVDPKKLRELATETIAAVARSLAFRLSHAAYLDEVAERRTRTAELIQKLLRDKEIEAIDRLFLLLCLIHPTERIGRIQRGLASASAKARASARELLENVLRAPLRDAVLAVVDDRDDAARLAAIGRERSEPSYAALLEAMIAQGGELAVLAAYHASELGLRDDVAAAVSSLDVSATAFGEALSTHDLGKGSASSGMLPTPNGAAAG